MITINYKSLKIPVIASEKGWLAVDKPAGLTVHNDPGQDLCSIARDYIDKKTKLFKHICLDKDYGIHAVHRLDRETSGIILLAADREIFRFFSKEFESRRVKKRYIAILHGPLAPPETRNPDEPWGNWQWPLAKDAGGRKNPAGTGQKKPCKTLYRVLDHSTHYTMTEIELLTGRKHQIRRHAKLAKHPVVGDTRYGSDRAVTFLKETLGFERLGLHARSLTVALPDQQRTQIIETSDIPDQMRELFEKDQRVDNPR